MGARKDRVRSLAGILEHNVVGVVDEIEVVARAAEHDVGAAFAVEDVVARIAKERVGEAVAVTLQVRAALQHQRLDVGFERAVDRGEHSVVAFAGVLGDSVAGIVHEIEVVAGPALREVGAAVAVQEIGPASPWRVFASPLP